MLTFLNWIQEEAIRVSSSVYDEVLEHKPEKKLNANRKHFMTKLNEYRVVLIVSRTNNF